MEWKYSIKNYITRCFWKCNSMVLIAHNYSYALNELATNANFIFVQKKKIEIEHLVLWTLHVFIVLRNIYQNDVVLQSFNSI